MRHYARLGGHDEERWGLVGLLHDFDYERWPDPPQHTRAGAKVLGEKGVDQEVIEALFDGPWWCGRPGTATRNDSPQPGAVK